MTNGDVRRIIEEKLLEHGLDDDEAVEVVDSIMDALLDEGFLDFYTDTPDEEISEYEESL